jgi:hypothetical protein
LATNRRNSLSEHGIFLNGLLESSRHEECLSRDRKLFERFELLDLHNVVVRSMPGLIQGCVCSYGAECKHVQTQRHDRSTFPWQNDYSLSPEIYSSRCLATTVLSWSSWAVLFDCEPIGTLAIVALPHCYYSLLPLSHRILDFGSEHGVSKNPSKPQV